MSLQLRDVTARFGSKIAIQAIDLDIGAGERFAIMGPSGSGKSTLLRVIAGLTAATTGSVTVDGVLMGTTPAHQRSVGLMFQDYALFPHMSVLDNVTYGLRMAGQSKHERFTRGGELLDLVGLTGFEQRKPETLSGGEQQRVALARTLAPEPSVVLLDEPLGSLDVSLREVLLVETRAILDAVGATSVYVTHDRSEAFAFAERMAILHDGRIEQVGTPNEIWDRPGSEYVARAIGQSNLVLCSAIGRTGDGLCFVPGAAARIDRRGRFRGTAERARFDDGDYIITVRLDQSGTTLDVHSADMVAPGAEVWFSVDQAEVVEVSTDQI